MVIGSRVFMSLTINLTWIMFLSLHKYCFICSFVFVFLLGYAIWYISVEIDTWHVNVEKILSAHKGLHPSALTTPKPRMMMMMMMTMMIVLILDLWSTQQPIWAKPNLTQFGNALVMDAICSTEIKITNSSPLFWGKENVCQWKRTEQNVIICGQKCVLKSSAGVQRFCVPARAHARAGECLLSVRRACRVRCRQILQILAV